MPSIIQGRIVYPFEPIPDPQGENAKQRPCVVISSNNEIKSGAPLKLVAISRDVYGKPDEVLLPYGLNCHTRLRQRSAAICTWVITIGQSEVEVGKGIVPPIQLQQILQKVATP